VGQACKLLTSNHHSYFGYLHAIAFHAFIATSLQL